MMVKKREATTLFRVKGLGSRVRGRIRNRITGSFDGLYMGCNYTCKVPFTFAAGVHFLVGASCRRAITPSCGSVE